MDKERRKKLKAEAKEQLARESRELNEALDEAIPVGHGHPDWGRYFTENTLREKKIAANRTRVLSGGRLGRDLSAVPMRPSADGVEYATERTYLRCRACSDLLPTTASRQLRCGCGATTITPSTRASATEVEGSAELVQVLAKAPPIAWWHIGRRLGWSLSVWL